MPGEYAVHILCDDEDIPKSPYIAQVLPKTDYHPEKVPPDKTAFLFERVAGFVKHTLSGYIFTKITLLW
jgi:hypothetical protein